MLKMTELYTFKRLKIIVCELYLTKAAIKKISTTLIDLEGGKIKKK